MEEKNKMASNLEEDKTEEVNKEQQDMVNDEKRDGKVANEKDDEVKSKVFFSHHVLIIDY